MTPQKNAYGPRLKEAREALKMTQAVFAEPLELTWTNVKDIEIGRKKLTPELAHKIEIIHKINLRWLLTAEGPMFLSRAEESPPDEPADDETRAAVGVVQKDILARKIAIMLNMMPEQERRNILELAERLEQASRDKRETAETAEKIKQLQEQVRELTERMTG